MAEGETGAERGQYAEFEDLEEAVDTGQEKAEAVFGIEVKDGALLHREWVTKLPQMLPEPLQV